MADVVQRNVLCNGAKLPTRVVAEPKPLRLDYRGGQNQNIKIELPDFIQSVFHLPDRILDLLELAAYVYCADRSITRGPKDAVEFHKWSRSFHFHVKVRDFDFWKQPKIARLLNEALSFLSGDREFVFTFQPGHRTPPADLFDRDEFALQSKPNTKIALFSGGLDSLAGVSELLANSSDNLFLISHRSSQPGTTRTQNQLVKALVEAFPNRIQHYKFYCCLTDKRAAEETQRTRMFLYSSIAVSLCSALSQQKFSIFENGITSLNFTRRQDLMNGRATRTTHPKTIHLLQQLFSEIIGHKLTIETPFVWNTKADVLESLGKSSQRHLIPSAVSCSKTFLNLEQASHCGGCSQCIDRRIATYAAGLAETDEPDVYAFDFINKAIKEGEVRTTLLDYIRQARDFAEWNPDHFCHELLNELAELVDYVGAKTEEEANTKIWELCRRHGMQTMEALNRIRNKHDKLSKKIPAGSLLKLIAEREYLKTPVSLQNKHVILTNFMNIDCLMLTAIPKELSSVLYQFRHFRPVKATTPLAFSYFETTAQNGMRVIAATPTGMGQLEAAALAHEAITTFSPKALLLVGIAGGLDKNIPLGDVVVSEQIVDYEIGKVTDGGFGPRWSVYRPDARLLAKAISWQNQNWQNYIKSRRPRGVEKPTLRSGVFLSGNKVIADEHTAGALRAVWKKAAAIDMEAAGVASVLMHLENPPAFLTFKGICDYADATKNDDWQEYSADAAAACAFSFVLEHLTPSDIRADLSRSSGATQGKVADRALRESLALAYNLSELKVLCFDIGIDWDELPQGPKSQMIVDLIQHVRRHGKFTSLVDAVNRDRDSILSAYSDSVGNPNRRLNLLRDLTPHPPGKQSSE